MSDARWRTVQELFLAVRELPADARDAHLRDACGADASLRAQVERLLAADAGEGILDRAAPALAMANFAIENVEADAPVEQRVGPYLVSGEIGRGGMGTVYRAYDPRLRRDVALKFLPAGWHQDPAAKARFIDEARAASALDHPHTCPVYDIGSTDDGRIYIAMAYCAGGSLAARLATGPMPIDQAVRVAVQVAGALDRAHEAGIVHRDIKPANIAFTEHGEARVLDFGIAVLGTDEWEAPSVVAGTPAYMAPEQVRGEAVDRRTDVWALGVVLYEMLTGVRPFPDGGQVATRAIVAATPNDVRAVRPDVPPALAAAVARALAKDPAARFASAAEFSAAITAAIAASTAGAVELRRRRRLTRMTLAAGLVAVAAAAVVYTTARQTRPTSGAPGIDGKAVAILPFRVRGEPSIGYLREGMADLLAAKLTGEGGLRATDPRAVYAGWRRTVASERDDLPLDSAVALATRLGAGNVLVGDVVGTAATIVVNASIRNARGAVTATASGQGTHNQLSALVDRLVAQLLTTSSGEEPQRLATLTSTSLPALRAYLEGQAAYRRGRYGEALEQFSRALDLDSTFALAGLGLVLADGWVGTGHAGDRGRAVAWRWRERLSVRDNALLAAHIGAEYPWAPTARERLAATENALRIAPDHVELWYQLGDLHFHFGRIVGTGDWETQAERALRRAVQSDSTFAAPIHHLVGLYARQRRHRDLRALVGATRTYGLDGATADYIRWRAAIALGEPAPDSVALDSMATETIGWIGMIAQDDGVAPRLGEHAIRLRLARPSTRAERFERHLSLHAVALNAGRPRAAAALSEAVREIQPDSSFHLRLRVLSGLYGDGDRLAAAEAAEALGAAPRRGRASRLDRCVRAQWLLASGDPLDQSVRGAVDGAGSSSGSSAERLCDATVEATRAVLRRDPSAARAIARLDDLLRTGLTGVYLGDGEFDYASIALARLLDATGDRSGALVALRRRPYFIGWQPFLAASLRYEGQLAAAAGDRDGAVRAYEHHLALRYDPEPALRASTDSVRGELTRLSAARQGREGKARALPLERVRSSFTHLMRTPLVFPILVAALVAATVVTPSDVPRFGEVALSTGIRMHFAEQGESRGEPIILLHGYSDSWFSFSRVLTPLARTARVYALDLRGHGKTDKPGSGYTMRDLAADVLAFMDAKGIVRATVIGHSMGGFVAQQVALAAPKRVSHLVLVNTARTGPDVTGFVEMENAVATLTDPVPEAFVREFQVSTVHSPVGDAFIDRAVAESLRLPARVWRELAAGMRATPRAVALGRSGIPTLVLRGEQDAYVSAAENDSLIAMVRASLFKVYPNTGHALHWEQPATFATDVLAFRGTTR